MLNLEEDLKNVVSEVMEDGTIHKMLKERVIQGFERAIDDSFKWGELNKAITTRVKEVLVPFVESYDMSDYITKMDTILVDIIEHTALNDNKAMLKNFKSLMLEPEGKTIKLSEIFKAYKKYVEENMETSGREVEYECGEPEYTPMSVRAYVDFEEDRGWSHFEYGVIELATEEEDQENTLNRTIKISRYKNDKKEDGYRLSVGHEPTITSLRHMNDFDTFLLRLERAGVKVILDFEDEFDEVYASKKPEPTYE